MKWVKWFLILTAAYVLVCIGVMFFSEPRGMNNAVIQWKLDAVKKEFSDLLKGIKSREELENKWNEWVKSGRPIALGFQSITPEGVFIDKRGNRYTAGIDDRGSVITITVDTAKQKAVRKYEIFHTERFMSVPDDKAAP